MNICSFRPEKRIGYKAHDGLSSLFNLKIEIPRIKHEKRQTVDTLISEEVDRVR
jgi:hypothetical protein